MSDLERARVLRAWPAPTAAWLAWALAGGAGVAAWLALRAGAFSADTEPICLLRRVAHLACPTCGMTRALALLAGGEWRAALALHPWAPVIAAQLVAGWAWWGAWLARLAKDRPDRWLPSVAAFNLAALVLLWLVRLVTGTLPAV